jgi:Ca2+-binding EF-hand superfamily protein
MKSLGIYPSEQVLKDMIPELDTNGNGSFDFDELTQLMTYK